MKNLKSTYIEISSEQEMNKASTWLESKGYKNSYEKEFDVNGTYLYIGNENNFHFNIESKNPKWKPFSVLYDGGMPRDVVRDEEEDLLAKAKRLYPIGTKYKCAAGGYDVHTVESMDWYPSPSGHIYGEISKGCIYKLGKWAEIVHEVKPIEKWSVGSYVVFLTDEVKTNSGTEITKGKPYRINEKHYDLLYSKSDTKKDFNFFWEKEENIWFATLEEAEVYSKSLQPFIKEEVIKYVICINDVSSGAELNRGKIYEVEQIDKQFDQYKLKGLDCKRDFYRFQRATKEEYDAQQLVNVSREEYIDTTIGIKPFLGMSKDELLDYAKKKYPIGCKVSFPNYVTNIVSKQLSWQYKNLISHSGCCPILDIKDGVYTWAEIIEMPKIEVQSTYQPIVTSYSHNGVKATLENMYPDLELTETHQSINKTGKQFSPIKVELIKVKQLKIN